MNLTIYHNPRCSKSRRTLQIIEEHGIRPTIVDYLHDPPAAATTLELARMLGVPVASLLRDSEEELRAAGAALDRGDDRAVATWLEQHPRALERPIVVDDDRGRAVIGRPPDNVRMLLRS